ncbi:putative spermidine/putrescine transport system permease protein [Flavimobilis soli]|uniref:Putative spermidine/putrescine transport system permease protein n=1 Tax=Flavimobilis soli TaxID=442709 RepID=A0A2A9EG08_9MICO|nr:ABC transporter permease subunit [Flavimobilis soli]PFG37763.1 putative spermidine/putrescine transport system permease protein [Flavimobilis soli]
MVTATVPVGRAHTARPAAPARGRAVARLRAGAGLAPFFGYTAVFLLLPTLIVVDGAFRGADGALTLDGLRDAATARTAQVFWTSTWLSAVTAAIGTVVGGVLAYALSTAPVTSVPRKVLTGFSSVLAQFGGVMLAFAFIATLGTNGMVTRLVYEQLGLQVPPDLLSSMTGLVVVYAYFQVPLMIIVFLPALDRLRPQWREATAVMGGTTAQFWRRVAGPILLPQVLGAFLLLFANAFSAFATAAALISQQTVLVPMAIESAIRNENNTGMDSYAQVLALGMVVVVALVMGAHALLLRRAARWTKDAR